MIGRALKVALCALILSLVGAELLHNRELARNIGLEKARWARATAACDQLTRENSRLRASAAAAPALAALKSQQRKLAGSGFGVDILKMRENALRRLLGLPSSPVWFGMARVFPAEAWSNAGQRTPAAALESVLWAARGGDDAALASLLSLTGDAKSAAEAAFVQLPAQEKARYANPQSFIAAVVASEIPDDYAAFSAMELKADSQSAALATRIEEGSGEQRDLVLSFTRTGGAWTLNVPAVAIRRYADSLGLNISFH